MELGNNENYRDSDEDIDDATHAKLIRNVLNLNSKQFVKKPSRTEPTVNISEYDLVKRGRNVHLRDLARALKGRGKKHVEMEKKLRKVGKKGKTLPKPLEKPQADRIRRTVGYEKSKEELDKWEPVVTSMRATPQIKFPLRTKVNLTNEHGESKWRMKSDLEKELEEIQPKVEVIEVKTEKKFPMSIKEMMEKRREAAKLRAYQSYKEAKARRQNKIKSKKYHRIQKRERVKQQMKEFELLQKTDPQAALEKLEEIEKARALERISLRHKGTGKWAKNKQIRAKYDKESRQVLAQQLAISRDLTQKQKLNDSDSEYEEKENENVVRINNKNSSNPWINGANIKVSKEVDDFVSGYRKYWEEKNGIKNENKEVESAGKLNGTEEKSEDDKIKETVKEKQLGIKKQKIKQEGSAKNNANGKQLKKINQINTNLKNTEKINMKASKREELGKVKSNSDGGNSCNTDKANKRKRSSGEKKSTKKAKANHQLIDENISTALGTSEWDVVDVDKELTKSNTKLQKELQTRYNKLKKDLATSDKSPKKKKKKPAQKKPDLSIPVQHTRPIIDEELGETTSKEPTNDVTKLKMILDDPTPIKEVKDIDPDKFMRVKTTTTLDTEIPDLIDFEDNEEDEDQKDVITEAFEDDDIADKFHKEKKDEINENKVGKVDLTLPGWGSWGGKDIKVPTRKRRRFMMKFPKVMARKDKNKGDLIVKEGTSAKLKPHLVSEVPFPFKSVKDYEASIRAPVGNTFVPEIAHRKMIQPAVVTKMGAVIEPITEDVLLRKKK